AARPPDTGAAATSSVIRGASPPRPPYTLSRSPLRRLAPFAWLARCARSQVDLSAVDRQDPYGAGERPAHAERNHDAPQPETRRERGRREQAGAEHEGRRRGEQRRERRQRRQALHDRRIQVQRQHHLSFGGLRPPRPPYTLSRSPLRRLAPFAWLAR